MDRAHRNQLSYDRIARAFLERQRESSVMYGWMQRFAARVPRGLVVDLGAGPCHQSAALRGLGLNVVSVDRSRQMLSIARQEFPGPRIQADLRQLPFRRRSVAGVWASASLLHLERNELAPTLASIAEVLVLDGVLFLSLKCGSGEYCDTASYGLEVPRWFTLWTEPEVDAALSSAGFELLAAETGATANALWIERLALRT